MQTKTTLVLGIGNTLLTDEGVGVHLVRYLAGRYPGCADTTFLDGGTLSFTLAGDLASHHQLIVVDAARTGAPPASVTCFEGAAMDRYLAGNRQSVHEVGLGDLLDIARLSDHCPEQRALIGIEPYSLDWGESLSDPVAGALPLAAERVISLIEKWAKRRTEADGESGEPG